MTFQHNEGPEPLATVGASGNGSAGKLEPSLDAPDKGQIKTAGASAVAAGCPAAKNAIA
jgi:hypothetical protein